MKKNKFIFKVVAVWILFFVAAILIFKNTVLFSYIDVCTITPTEINTTDYNVEGSRYEPLSENATVELQLPYGEVNNLQINFGEKVSENKNVFLYYYNDNSELVEIDSKNISIENNQMNIIFEKNSYKKIYIRTNQGFSLDNIVVRLRILNFFQKNVSWLIEVLSIGIVSLIMSLSCAILNSKFKKNSLVSQNQRESNLELLRIVCMLLIVAHHCVVHGGAINMRYSFNKLFSYVFLPAEKICFVAFIAMSTWFLVDSKFKSARFLKIWLQTFFYSVVVTIVAVCLGAELTVIEFFSTFLPITGNSHGYASAYLCFYLFLPFILYVTEKLTREQARYLLVISFYAQVISQIIGYITNYYQALFSELSLFVFCFILSYNLKKWPVKLLSNRVFTGSIFAGIWLLFMQINYMELWGRNTRISNFLIAISGSESSLLMIIAGYALFFWAKETKIKKNTVINKISTCTLAVLLIHDHNFFRTYIWGFFAQTVTWYHSPYFILLLIITIGLIFFVCSIIEYIRKSLFEDPIVASKYWKRLTRRWDGILDNVREKNE